MKTIKTNNYIKLARSRMPISQTTILGFSILQDGQLVYDPKGTAANRPNRDNWFKVEVSFEGTHYPTESWGGDQKKEFSPSMVEYEDTIEVTKANNILRRYGIEVGHPFPKNLLTEEQINNIFDKMEDEAREREYNSEEDFQLPNKEF